MLFKFLGFFNLYTLRISVKYSKVNLQHYIKKNNL